MAKKKNSKKSLDKFIVTGATVTILVNHIIDGKPGPTMGMGSFVIPRSDWKTTEKILGDNIKKLCEKNEIEEIKLIN